MREMLTPFYRFFGGEHFFKVCKRHRLACTWSVEAGCHDGSDALSMIHSLHLETVFAFEPDDVARAKAQALLEPYLGKVVFLSPQGLSDVSGRANLVKNVSFGDGSSQVRKITAELGGEISSISLTRLDEVKIDRESGGVLWLDVEGHAVQALTGAIKTLRAIDVAKIEVQMHDMSDSRKTDADTVIKLCRTAGLTPVYFPLHPSSFGDIIFIRDKKLSYGYRILAFINLIMFSTLHKLIYPVIGRI